MNLKNKIASVMTFLSVSMLLLILVVYYNWNHYMLIEEEQTSIVEISNAVSQEINTHFDEITNTVKTLASAPIIQNELEESNMKFAALSDIERDEHIASLGERWTETSDLDDPFLQTYMNNQVSNYLNMQKDLIKERYGELFITNRYGVIIASTNKLTTINHSHKYWWVAGYAEGLGRIFLDDRGFDTSAEGYVLGIVVPIKQNNEVIGLIKANVNIFDILNHVIDSYEELYTNSNVKIVRTGGLIVAEKGIVPLSTVVCDKTIEQLGKKVTSYLRIDDEENNALAGISEIPITKGTDTIGFGGSYESIDHIQGNTGESWHSVICLDDEEIIAKGEGTTRLLFGIGVLFTLVIFLVAMYIGKKISDPIVKLAHFSEAVGNGVLDDRITINSKDEIGLLANSYNEMVDNLKNTMASKNELLQEVEKRKHAEEKLFEQTVTDELTGIHNRRAANEFLRNSIEKVQRYDEILSAIILDIDHFKNVNDTYGHDIGDVVLITLARILKEGIRNVDMVARVGGEEFLILLPQISNEQAYVLAERLRITISEYKFEKIEHLTVSMGVSELKAEDTFDSLLKRVDDGLYKSKNNGRNRVTLL